MQFRPVFLGGALLLLTLLASLAYYQEYIKFPGIFNKKVHKPGHKEKNGLVTRLNTFVFITQKPSSSQQHLINASVVAKDKYRRKPKLPQKNTPNSVVATNKDKVSVLAKSLLNYKLNRVTSTTHKLSGRARPATAKPVVPRQPITTPRTSFPSAPTLLVIFTTFKKVDNRFQIHSNVLHNWCQFIPSVVPILFYEAETDRRLVDLAKKLSWTTLRVPRVNEHGTPYLKEMYTAAQRYVPNADFYGYANGDLLFDNGLTNTLSVINRLLSQTQRTLVIGRRINYDLHDKELYKIPDVHAATEYGTLFREDAEDFFFIAHNSFPWNKLVDVVIGRPAYDNYLVAMALRKEVSVIDVTRTVKVIHQTGVDGDFAGFQNEDKEYNKNKIGEFEFSEGLTSASQYETRLGTDGFVELWHRYDVNKNMRRFQLTTPKPPMQFMNRYGDIDLDSVDKEIDGIINSNN